MNFPWFVILAPQKKRKKFERLQACAVPARIAGMLLITVDFVRATSHLSVTPTAMCVTIEGIHCINVQSYH